MNSFSYFQPTEIIFGCGKLAEVGRLVARYGHRCLVVSVPLGGFMRPLADRIDALLGEAGLVVAHFDGIIPTPRQ